MLVRNKIFIHAYVFLLNRRAERMCTEQCDQVPKLQNRQIFAENRHDWRVNFRPQILPAKLPATIRNRLISSYFNPFFLHFYEVRLIIT